MYILIIILSLHNVTSTSSIEFSSVETCKVAANNIVAEYKSDVIAADHMYISCEKK